MEISSIYQVFDRGTDWCVFEYAGALGFPWPKGSEEGRVVEAYLAEHPEALVPEPVPPPPTIEQMKAQRIAEIKAQILALDAATIRPMRAGETTRVEEIEAQVLAFRMELAELT